MSYKLANPPSKLFNFPAAPSYPPPASPQNAFWLYQSGDDRSEVECPGYIIDAAGCGLLVGDIVMSVNTRDGAVTLHRVQGIDQSGAATVSRAVPR